MAGQILRFLRVIPAALACCGLFLSASAVGQPAMSRAEVAQLYTVAGFPIANGQPVNRCGTPAKPKITFVDINGDKNPEALVIDTDATCYAPAGRYFAVLVKERVAWRAIVSGNGSIQALSTKTTGWLDMRVSDAGCTREFRYDGRNYSPTTTCARDAVASAPGSPKAVPPPQRAPVPGMSPPIAAASQAAATKKTLDAADQASAFKAAGFKKQGSTWRNCDDRSASGSVERVDDFNGDGLPDAVLVEGGTACYGMTAQAFWLVSKRADGTWKLMTGGPGIAEFLKTKGVDGWPDVSIGGPGFCFPIERWNGKEYKLQRHEYEGKPCKPPR